MADPRVAPTSVPLSLIKQLLEFDTPTVAESLATLGCPHHHKYYMGCDVRLLTPVPILMVGLARSWKWMPARPTVLRN